MIRVLIADDHGVMRKGLVCNSNSMKGSKWWAKLRMAVRR